MKIAVFGSSGFIGSQYVKSSIHETVPVKRGTLYEKADQVLFLIGTTDNYNVFTDPTIDIKTNLIELIATLEEYRKQNNNNFIFNYVSSWFVYGEGKLPSSEDQKCNPKGFYSITKYSAELLLESYCKTFNIPYRILRLANVIGPTDTGVSKKKNALQFLIFKLKNNEDIELYENGDLLRDYIHVSDVANAIDLVLGSSLLNTIINIGNGDPKKLADLIEIARIELKSKSKISSIKTPKFHNLVQVKDSYLNVTKLKSLGYSPKCKIEEELVNL